MATNPKDGKLLYHLTALDNIESILEKGLLPREKIDFDFLDVADKEILKDRKKFDLSEYTPFHFFCPTPFSGAAQIAQEDSEFVYIAITRKLAESNKFKIVPRHPLNFDGNPLEWGEGIETIDWGLMEKRVYSDYDCREACMAESLFKGTILPKHFNCIFVKNEEVKSEIISILKRKNLSINVNVNKWFFVNR
ncbi:DarT ssDNA thymidine ADP-ribosyltransferase family protein [Zunongwangia pacifica]|uniref:DUF4433 domain-containing protein n=1 Tax=Zunongwangia pacifica TaxID=2911062 RepID=A0A9X2A1Q1_9FLAO|nr:DarT ssDNA thymidine ADP-ribosyltransferase family protein [Zunongwangia pacifica]MCL6220436.1 DUF4433 domain-containing protein [Zunongwangia pacifica]